MADDLPGDLVGLAERHPLLREVVREVGGREEPVVARRPHPLLVHRHPPEQQVRPDEAILHGARRIEDRLLVLLHVPVVRERKPLHEGEEVHEVPVGAPGLPADELGHVGVLLLRHDAAPGAQGVRKGEEAELRGRPVHHLLGEPRQVHHRHGARVQEVGGEVAIRHGVDAVLAHTGHSQFPRRDRPVQGERGAGQRPRPERRDVHAPARLHEPVGVPGEHLPVRQEVMGEEDRLGPLQMGVAGKDDPEKLFGPGDDGFLDLHEEPENLVDFIAQVQPEIDGNLVVAAAPRVQLSPDGADPADQATLDRHVDVLVREIEGKFPGIDLPADSQQTLDDPLRLGLRQDAPLSQHPRVGDAAGDVVPVEQDVVRDRSGELLDEPVGRAVEAPPPRLLFRHVSLSRSSASTGS